MVADILEYWSRRSADQGRIVEDGWLSFRKMVIPPDAPAIQVSEMHKAFLAGAQHLFGSIMTILEPGAEPTEKDLARMDLIAKELGDFYKLIKSQK